MKRTVISLFFLAAGLVTLTTLAVAQNVNPTPLTQPVHAFYAYGQLRGVTTEQALRNSAAATTIPMWSYSVNSTRDSANHTGVMVGRSPFFHGARETDIPIFIVPLKVNMPDGGVFDPGVADPTCLSSKVPTTVFQNSPLFQQVTDYFMNGSDIGTAQYIDAFQRANFFNENVSVTGGRYHTVVKPTVLAEQTFNVPAG
jgi:hypothetical protein